MRAKARMTVTVRLRAQTTVTMKLVKQALLLRTNKAKASCWILQENKLCSSGFVLQGFLSIGTCC